MRVPFVRVEPASAGCVADLFEAYICAMRERSSSWLTRIVHYPIPALRRGRFTSDARSSTNVVGPVAMNRVRTLLGTSGGERVQEALEVIGIQERHNRRSVAVGVRLACGERVQKTQEVISGENGRDG